VGLERGPLNLVSTTEELLERKSSGSGTENRDYSPWIFRADYATPLYPQDSALTSPTRCGRLASIVCSQTKGTELLLLLSSLLLLLLLLQEQLVPGPRWVPDTKTDLTTGRRS
jgi:hypothetical protein